MSFTWCERSRRPRLGQRPCRVARPGSRRWPQDTAQNADDVMNHRPFQEQVHDPALLGPVPRLAEVGQDVQILKPGLGQGVG